MAKSKRYKVRDNVLIIETLSDEPIDVREHEFESLLEHRAAVEKERDRVFAEKTVYMAELDEAIAEAKKLGLDKPE